MKIQDFIDPQVAEHVAEFQRLNRTGSWSPAFYQKIKDFEFDNCWQVAIAAKFAEAYCDIF